MTRRSRRAAAAVLTAAFLGTAALGSAGCTVEKPRPPVIKTKYADIPKDPSITPGSFMVGTIKERTLLANTEPWNVSGYALVGRLRGTGDCEASTAVRQFIVKEMYRHGFGSATGDPLFRNVSASDILNDPNYAIVRVDAWIPPGARKDDFIDAQVTCIEKNKTASLLHGQVFEADLKQAGADMDTPRGAVNAEVRVKGPILVNPAYAMHNPAAASAQARASLRTGHVMFNARVMADRPLVLRMRQPEFRLTPLLADRISNRFQREGTAIARAKNEALIEMYVPRSFNGDWERFAKVVQHLYLQDDPAFNAAAAERLARAAVEPGAPLEDISYCWEGIGANALPYLSPLLNHPDPAVAYWAARAAAFIESGSPAAEARLAQMVRDPNHPFQLAALMTLGSLPNSSSLSYLIKPFVRSEQALVRIGAYRILARNNGIQSVAIAPSGDPSNQKFMLDVIPTDDPPVVFVTRSGKPRIGIIGRMPTVKLDEPITILDNRLTITAGPRAKTATLFFRDPHLPAPVRVDCPPTLDVLIARLAGRSTADGAAMDFTYGEIVSIVQTLIDGGCTEAPGPMGSTAKVAFMMQDPPRIIDDLTGTDVADASIIGPNFGPGGEVPGAPAPAPGQPTAAAAAPSPERSRPAPPPPPAAGSSAPDFGQGPTALPPAATPTAPPVTPGEGSNAPKF